MRNRSFACTRTSIIIKIDAATTTKTAVATTTTNGEKRRLFRKADGSQSSPILTLTNLFSLLLFSFDLSFSLFGFLL